MENDKIIRTNISLVNKNVATKNNAKNKPYPSYDKTCDLKEDFGRGEFYTDDGINFYRSRD
ncbi:MAG: hypothetical protein IJQ07_08030 [Clostridia bacterium]|nr:hypothetical protein [Clostridia bacterium]